MISSGVARASDDPTSWFKSRIHLSLQILRESNQPASDSLRESLNDVKIEVGEVFVKFIEHPITGKKSLPRDYIGAERQIATDDNGKDHVFIRLTPFYQASIQAKWQRMTGSVDLQKKLEALDCFRLLFGDDSPHIPGIKNSINGLMMNDMPKVNYGPKHR